MDGWSRQLWSESEPDKLTTKLTVVEFEINDKIRAWIAVVGGEIEYVEECLTCRMSLVMSNGMLVAEVDGWIINASRAFRVLYGAVFSDSHLTVATKRKVYNSCVHTVLLYGSKCWTMFQRDQMPLTTSAIIRTVLNITNRQKWEQ